MWQIIPAIIKGASAIAKGGAALAKGAQVGSTVGKAATIAKVGAAAKGAATMYKVGQMLSTVGKGMTLMQSMGGGQDKGARLTIQPLKLDSGFYKHKQAPGTKKDTSRWAKL